MLSDVHATTHSAVEVGRAPEAAVAVFCFCCVRFDCKDVQKQTRKQVVKSDHPVFNVSFWSHLVTAPRLLFGFWGVSMLFAEPIAPSQTA